MAQGPNYNVILPFTVTNTLVPSTFVVGGMTVNGTLTAQQFVALSDGSNLAPAYSFATGTNTGMFATATSLSFSVQGTTVMGIVARSFQGGPTIGAVTLNAGTGSGAVFLTGAGPTPAAGVGLAIYKSDGTTVGEMTASLIRCTVASSNSGLTEGTGGVGYVFDVDSNPAILNLGVPGTYAATWDRVNNQYFCRPGLSNYATNTITPSIARSGAHLTNLISGVTTVFFSLPTSIAGLKYTFTNSNSSANTVVVSPQTAADTINVFGLTKAAGASVAANAPFSSITLHCITSTQWLATEMQGTWT